MGIMEKNMGTVIVRSSGFGLGGLGSRFGGLGVYGSSVSRGFGLSFRLRSCQF